MYQNKLTTNLGELCTIINNEMNDYSQPKYKGLYEEILKDYQFRYGKFNPIPYPFYKNLHHGKSQQSEQTS